MASDQKMNLPRWVDDVVRLLPIRSQFVLSGNIRDVFITATEAGAVLMPVLGCLWAALRELGYEFILVYDRVDGLRVFPQDAAIQTRASQLLRLSLQDGYMPVNHDSLTQVLRVLVSTREARAAAVIDFASRIVGSPQALEAGEQKFFAAMEKLSLGATPIAQKGGQGEPLHNPVIWLLNRAQDIPSWFVIDNQRTASLVIPLPDYDSRLRAAGVLGPLFTGFDKTSEAERSDFATKIADGTDGMSLQSLADIAQLARRRTLSISDAEDAVRSFKVGVVENPWRKDYLKEKIRHALDRIETRVKGQRAAATKTIDILTRSVMGLTGAQARSSAGRPRGVLFFAGPTGVGKTELAKALTQLLFGDEKAYIRFDMSEFSEEHAGARLLGAPPGYIGYESGGELTNAVKQRPFSVILFDEIEKGHPRLLDKFLQILEDGRLTDGRGDTVYFSESVLIFTSNLGIFVQDEEGRRVQNVTPTDAYDVVERKVREAIADHFKYRLGRPELLNRIGDNIVVFNFISPDVAVQIFDAMLDNVVRRVREEHKIELNVIDKARDKLRRFCTEDLTNGGRGIGNRLESTFINPLGRALFVRPLKVGDTVAVSDVSEADQVYALVLE